MSGRTTVIGMMMLALSLPGTGAGPGQPPSAPVQPMVKQVGKNRYRIGEIELNAETREIRFPAVVNQEKDTLEYILVTENGKVHESLLRTAISPAHLEVGMKLLRYRAGRGHLLDHYWPPGQAPVREAEGEPVELLVAWAERPAVPVCQAVLNRGTGKAMEETPWIYTGSEVIEGIFQAEAEGSIIALYRDGLAMLNSPHPESLSDENWLPMAGVLPPKETQVWVTVRPGKRQL